MEPVGITTIVLGALLICTRAPLVVAPGPTLRWWRMVFEKNSRVRILGAAMLPLTVAMIWAGSPAHSDLASVVLLLGLVWLAVSAPVLLPFPGLLRALANAILPADLSGRLLGWRIVGLAGVLVGGFVIYVGALAL